MQPDAFADVVVQAIKASLAPVLTRLIVAESKIAGIPLVEQAVADLRERLASVPFDELSARVKTNTDEWREWSDAVRTKLAALEARPQPELVAEPDEIPLEELASSFTGLLRKELELLSPAKVPMQKRVIRDQDGRVERVIEEPVI